ncbi:hypothetical protein [uncultured Gilvimarinus sp.]|uniref:hypothetical protein n=1 Tax=uncultured Gilvimarinus sp. TaxID=1689143 RepID=UPI0030EF6E29|tara:strand:+ start:1054 stop:1470 length:417 start_codon:yes stop_codon:yes gene_type:complete
MINKITSFFALFLFSSLSYSEEYALGFVSDVSFIYPKISSFQDINKEAASKYILRLKGALDAYDLGVSNNDIKDISRKGCDVEGLYFFLRYQEKVAGDIMLCLSSSCESHETNRIKYNIASDRTSKKLSECTKALDLN